MTNAQVNAALSSTEKQHFRKSDECERGDALRRAAETATPKAATTDIERRNVYRIMSESRTTYTLNRKPSLGSLRVSPLSSHEAAQLTASVFEGRKIAGANGVAYAASSNSSIRVNAMPSARSKHAPVAVGVRFAEKSTKAMSQKEDDAFSDFPAAENEPQRCTYLDCIAGRASVPQSGLSKSVFQLLMVGGMVTFMATFNGIHHSGLGFFAHAHWMYPLVFCIALLVRLAIANRLVSFVVSHVLAPRLKGLGLNIAITLTNVLFMGVVMGSIMALLLNSPSDFLPSIADTMPASLLFSAFVNYFIVGPAVKMICANHVKPGDNARILSNAQRYSAPWTALLGN